jgi:hypothetical protein
MYLYIILTFFYLNQDVCSFMQASAHNERNGGNWTRLVSIFKLQLSNFIKKTVWSITYIFLTNSHGRM